MNKLGLILIALTLLVLTAGCGAGIIYTHTYQPLTLDMHRTPVVPTSGQGDIKHIQIGQLGIAWDDASIGTIAKKNGLKELYYADLETLKVLTIWNQYTLHLYGK